MESGKRSQPNKTRIMREAFLGTPRRLKTGGREAPVNP